MTSKRSSDTPQTRQQLRQHYRALRQALPNFRQRISAKQLAATLKQSAEFKNAKTIASYLPDDGEIDPSIIHQLAWHCGKNIFLPVINKSQHSLSFAPFHRSTPLASGTWGIQQPRYAKQLARVLIADLILLPLVAFDAKGNRLGRGGGYYDRYLGSIKQHRNDVRVLGLAHDFQQAEQLSVEKWDVPVDGIVTPRKIIRC